MAEERTATLRVGEAVALAHALLAHLAQEEGVRVLFVKGPTAVAMGARPARPSSDVDVLCEPGGAERVGAALERRGWRRRVPASFTDTLRHAAPLMFEHSVHYIHDEWPCDLDIHFTFPGFLAPEDVVFDALWERRTTTPVAHRDVPCADLLGQAAIVGLHALRDPGVGHSDADLAFLTGALRSLGADEREELARLAAATGSDRSLRPLLDAVGAPTVDGPWSASADLARWQARAAHGQVPSTLWVIELRRAPWARKPLVLWRAVFLPKEVILAGHVGAEPGRVEMARLRLARLRRGLQSLRRAARVARDATKAAS
ncbi:MAG TPA: nucleotidyltransferase family protein [Pedococcus sp.]